jgi:hypothetical protein
MNNMGSKDNLQPHPSLPARPPPSSFAAPPVRNNNTGARPYGGNAPAAFAAFTPRSVVAHAPPQIAAPPTMYSQPTVSAPYQPTAYPSSNAYYNPYQGYGTAAPAATYSAPAAVNNGYPSNYDPEEEARIAEWNSAYTREDTNAKKGINSNTATRPDAVSHNETQAGTAGSEKQKTVVREAGGKKWEDPSLLEWNPQHPRLFIGNLAGEVTDDSLLKAFSRYPSVVKARVVRDKRSTKSKSYGFVSFSETDDYFSAAKEMQGKYIGSHPVLIKRATSEVKAVTKRDDRKHGKNNKNNNKNKKPSAAGPAPMPGVVPFSANSGVQKKTRGGGPRMLG